MINIDYSKDSSLTDFAKTLLKDFYMLEGETSPQEAFARASIAFCAGDYDLAQRMYEYASNQWLSFSSPILSNAPKGHWKFDDKGAKWVGDIPRAMPISCFLTYVPDTITGQIQAAEELAMLSIVGGGVGQHLKMRGITEKSPGAVPYLKTMDSNIMYYKQGKTRKGSVAGYLDVNHPDIKEFISVRVPTGGDINRKCFNVHNAINISEEFLRAVANNEDFNLVCPHTKRVVDVVKARELWESILETRARTGEPYLNLPEEANKQLYPPVKSMGKVIHGSNLCNEIHLPTDETISAVCCLSSVNLEYYDEWKNTSMVRDLTRFLDNVLQWFIDNASEELSKAVAGARFSRDLGIGAMGFHSYLQRNNLPYEGGGLRSAAQLSSVMFKHIRSEALAESIQLGKERGIPIGCSNNTTGYDGRRNANLLAIAPNANSSIIANTSASIEPIMANAYTHRTRVGSVIVKNKYLTEELKKWYPAEELPDVWKSILQNDGSVQHLEALPDSIKKVYRTAFEIDQHWVVEHARIRQMYVCQGQSVNLFFPAGSSKSYVHSVHMSAFDSDGAGTKLKGLYYFRTTKSKSIERVNTSVERAKLSNFEECLACQA